MGFALTVLSASSCTFVFDSGVEQCDVDDDCKQREFSEATCDTISHTCQPLPVDSQFGCIGKTAPKGTGAPVTIQLKVVSPINGSAPKANAAVRACALLDANCDQPLTEAVTDTAGDARVQLTDDFTGFFEIISQTVDPADPEIPILAFLPSREIIRGATGRVLFSFTQKDAQTLVEFAGASFPPVADSRNPTGPWNAVLTVTALDCQSNLLPGVSFELLSMGQRSPDTRQFYTNRNFPDTAKVETDVSGTFGLTNLKAGSVTIKSLINERQTPLADDTGAFVRDGWITEFYVAP